MHVRTIVQSKSSGYAIIVGRLAQNERHSHFSVHFVQELGAPVSVTVDGATHRVGPGLVIDSWVPHAIESEADDPVLIASVSPIGAHGSAFRRLMAGQPFAPLRGESAEIKKRALELLKDDGDLEARAAHLCAALNQLAVSRGAGLTAELDPRIIRALQAVGAHTTGFLPAADAASEADLSESRFLHLFRDQIGMTYRKMQRWIRLAKSFERVCAGGSLTETAFEFGFADSAHFSRAFHEAFGMAPTVLMQDSRFVQVR